MRRDVPYLARVHFIVHESTENNIGVHVHVGIYDLRRAASISQDPEDYLENAS